MSHSSNAQKEQYRGTIKQLMQDNHLRSISIANYNKWKQEMDESGFHSVKFDLQNGNINLFEYGKDGHCGKATDNISIEDYKRVHDIVLTIFNERKQIPNNIRRNILVIMSR